MQRARRKGWDCVRVIGRRSRAHDTAATVMNHDLTYGRERFMKAASLLAQQDFDLLGGWRNTENNRLRGAVLHVYGCGPQHFARREDHEAFAALLADLRVRDPESRVLTAIGVLRPDECAEYERRLLAIARGVIAPLAPAAPWPQADERAGGPSALP